MFNGSEGNKEKLCDLRKIYDYQNITLIQIVITIGHTYEMN